MVMDNHQTAPLAATYRGHVATTYDSLLLFEGCLDGSLNHVARRPHDRERQDLIRSGSVFIYEEHASGIKRWTDGVSWSPSRILGNFLIYRELEKPFPPGEKKRALKKNRKASQAGIVKAEASSNSSFSLPLGSENNNTALPKDQERSLIGSLVDSYSFKAQGLIKKTISITYNGVPHHLVSYYNVDDVTNGLLLAPSQHSSLKGLVPRRDLLMAQNFRSPLDELEYAPDSTGQHPLFAPVTHQDFSANGNPSQFPRTLSLPSFAPGSISTYGAPPLYGFGHHHQPYMNMNALPPSTMAPSAMTTNTSLTLAQPSQSNYALDPSRTTTRYGSNAMTSGYDSANAHDYGLNDVGNEASWAFDSIDAGHEQHQYYNGNAH